MRVLAIPGSLRATSSNALEVQTGDGQFTTVGEGFFWEQDGGLVTVSNRVHSVIRRDATNSPVATVSRTNLPPIDVFADHFMFQTQKRVGSYRDHVRVDDPQMLLTCALLTADLPQPDGLMKHIVAETNVVIYSVDEKGQTNHATTNSAATQRPATSSIRSRMVWRAGCGSLVASTSAANCVCRHVMTRFAIRPEPLMSPFSRRCLWASSC